MRIHLTMKRFVLLSFVMSISSWTIPSSHAADPFVEGTADPLVEGTMVLAPAGELNIEASGAAEDTLKACLARIPEDASAGQRLLAQQSCQGEEGTRRSVEVAPKF